MWRPSMSSACILAFVSACGGDDVPADGTADASESSSGSPSSTTMSTATSADGSGEASSASTQGGSTSSGGTDSSDDGSGSESSTGGEPDVNTRGSVVTECGALKPAATGTCELTSTGTSGVILRGTVLAPGEVFRGGSVFYSDAGIIECVDCDCTGAPGAADAAVVTCADGVISPGLVNPHDHITYANNYPIGEGVDRYEHRHDWRIGQGGHDDLPYNDEASNNVVAAAELRFVMSGATSAASAGGRMGLLRNLGNADQLEGLPVRSAFSDTFPLDDANGITDEMGCNYGDDRRTADDIAGLTGYLPHIAEGIDAAARNELTCTSSGTYDLIAPQTAVVHAIGVVPDDAATLHAD
ncbi:MAG: hypothetical protein IAG13_15285, partial [Deltaproteobacteria bacterium]|nr:hypothetical protein [Nannocystaceae bacterium]